MSGVEITQADKRIAAEIAANRIGKRDNGIVYAAALEAAALSRQSATAPLIAALGEVEHRLRGAREWASSLTVTDMNEIVADNGITAGMVVTQEAAEQVRRLDQALTRITETLAKHKGAEDA